MPVATVTRFRLRSASPVGYALFMWHTFRSAHQAERAPGCVRGALFADAGRAFWTLTVWTDAEAMRAYRNAGDHRRAMRAMRILDRFCDEAATATFEVGPGELPDPARMRAQLEAHGRFLTLGRPSEEHAARTVAAPRFLGGRKLRPRSRHRAEDAMHPPHEETAGAPAPAWSGYAPSTNATARPTRSRKSRG